MNAQDFIYDEMDEVASSPRKTASPRKTGLQTSGKNRPSFGRRGKAPKQFNGIHRRRTKKIRW